MATHLLGRSGIKNRQVVTDMHQTSSIGRLRQLLSRSVFLFLGVMMTIAGLSRPALAETTEVHIIDISGTIDLGIAAFLERQIDQAQSSGATAFIVVMDTPGGRVDAAISMRDALLATDMPTITLVDTTALSAGALIALATDTIYMTPGQRAKPQTRKQSQQFEASSSQQQKQPEEMQRTQRQWLTPT